jgi:two-component system alkaline phosphatase synthesis response regulator PhoP
MSSGKKRILFVEDENGLVLTLTDRLTSEGYSVTHAGDGENGEKLASESHYDIILLDVMLPKKNGFDIIRDLRKRGVTTPVLMLTARGQLNEKVVGLKLGADEYLTKPFEMLELLTRIESLLRRKGKLIELSAREFLVLRYFIEHRGGVLSRETILNDVWGYDAMPTTRTIDTHITWLRQKIEENPKFPKYILSVHGFAYKFTG